MECLYKYMKDDMIQLDSQITEVTGRLTLLYGHNIKPAEKNSEKCRNKLSN